MLPYLAKKTLWMSLKEFGWRDYPGLFREHSVITRVILSERGKQARLRVREGGARGKADGQMMSALKMEEGATSQEM